MTEGNGGSPPASNPQGLPAESLTGIAGSPGVAIGTAVVIGSRLQQVPRRTVPASAHDSEIARFRRATDRAKSALFKLTAHVSNVSTVRSVLEAYTLMVEDPRLHEEVEHRIKDENRCAEWAVMLAIEAIASELASSQDEYLRERSRDIEFVGEHVLRGFTLGSTIVPRIPSGPVVLVARDLSPADTAGLVTGGSAMIAPGATVVGFVTERGTRTSHTSITARALRVAAVVGVGDVFESVATGDMLVVDGIRGIVRVRPSALDLREAEQRAGRYLALSRELSHAVIGPPTTRDGTTVTLRANVEFPDEARQAHDAGAEGVGLYRTEFLYIERPTPPAEEEQVAAFRAVLEAMPGVPVTLRTFDVGGDKFASTFKLPAEANPMLGVRAVRLAKLRPDVFVEHLRAMVRAAAFGDLKIMVPMVAAIDELRWVREMLSQAKAELVARGERVPDHIPLGVMIEVPSAAVLADHFAREADFMSLGTNDLIQYSLAVDRSSRALAHLGSPFDPSILRLIHGVVLAGKKHDCPVSVCGAMAGDPLAGMLLLGLGLREFSLEVAAIPEMRETFRRATLAEAVDVATRALEMGTSAEVQALVTGVFGERLHDILAGEADEV